MSTEFKAGDRIRATNSGVTKKFYLVEVEGVGLVTYHPYDPSCPNVPFDTLLRSNEKVPDSLRIDYTLDLSVDDALPTTPGEYEDVARFLFFKNFPEEKGEYSDNPWVLNEDGTWTSPDGDNSVPASDNWMLAAEGFEFIPWSERDSIPETRNIGEFFPV